jgi:hypothetical protein
VAGGERFRDYATARGLADMSDEQFVTERALLTASLHDWNRAADSPLTQDRFCAVTIRLERP